MTDALDIDGNRYLAPGTRVRRDAVFNDDAHPTAEFGVVVHCWLDEDGGLFTCLTAFFGDSLPTGKPAHAPYLLRYAAVGLSVVPD